MAEGARLRVRGELRGGFFGAEMVHPTGAHGGRGRGAAGPPDPGLSGHRRHFPGLPAAIGGALGRTPCPRRCRSRCCRARWHACACGPLSSACACCTRRRNRWTKPRSPSAAHPAWQRVKFDELLAQQLSLKRAQAARRDKNAPATRREGGLLTRFLAALPFQLTGAQRRVVEEIGGDMAAPHPMHRLLQGDVGSGKTIVAALAACQAIDAGYQAALMAPTEIPSRAALPQAFGLAGTAGCARCGSRRQPEGARQARGGGARRSRRGAAAIGTHALIQDTVRFAAWACRWWTNSTASAWRSASRCGQATAPPMTGRGRGGGAAPADDVGHADPRTLAMTYYADLDVSVIDELPPGARRWSRGWSTTPAATR